MATITFKPKQVSKRLLSVLPSRARDIVSKRFGLNQNQPLTLEAIGQEYDITRERVRQIENFALQNIKKSDEYEAQRHVFEELHNLIHDLGGVVSEDELLSYISKDPIVQNHIHFFLALGATFQKHKEDADFRHRWTVDADTAQEVYAALKKLYAELSDEELVAEPDLVKRFLSHLQNVSTEYKKDEILKRWLGVSKRIDKNPLGEWGMADSPNVRARGMRDYAFLVIRRHGNPMHFTEVAKAIEDTFGKKAHVATCHNELIKDPRFVLVGRGLYALDEWGYVSGVVRDVLTEILEKYGPLTKEEIVDKVMKERYVKQNTILVNLQNSDYFHKGKDGTYSLVA